MPFGKPGPVTLQDLSEVLTYTDWNDIQDIRICIVHKGRAYAMQDSMMLFSEYGEQAMLLLAEDEPLPKGQVGLPYELDPEAYEGTRMSRLKDRLAAIFAKRKQS